MRGDFQFAKWKAQQQRQTARSQGKKSTKESFNANAAKDCNRNKDDSITEAPLEALEMKLTSLATCFATVMIVKMTRLRRKDLYESVVSRIFIPHTVHRQIIIFQYILIQPSSTSM